MWEVWEFAVCVLRMRVRQRVRVREGPRRTIFDTMSSMRVRSRASLSSSAAMRVRVGMGAQ